MIVATGEAKQSVTLGVDAGSKFIGISASTKKSELYASEVILRLDDYYLQKQVRKHNRQIHKMTINKGGIRKRNQASYEIKGFRLFDKVRYRGQEAFIWGRRNIGNCILKLLTGEKIVDGAGFSKLTLLESRKTFLTQLIHS